MSHPLPPVAHPATVRPPAPRPAARRPGALLAASLAALAAAVPASSQQGKAPTMLWMDVATHAMAGMPEMGGLGRMAMGMAGGGNHYGATRFGGMPGRHVDIALLNQRNPGAPAEDRVPAALELGNSLPLLPPASAPRAPAGDGMPPRMQDAKARILVYWGCSPTVRAGQPREIRIDVKDGKVQTSGTLQGRYVPDRGIDVGPSYALWPNARDHRPVPAGASLAGEHRIAGAKVPESMTFTLAQAQDFMPAIALRSSGSLQAGQTWAWQPVDRAKAYYLYAMGVQGDAMVLWSSAEAPDAGMGIFDYLPPAIVDKWVKDKVLLPASASSCAMPGGIFAAPGEGGGNAGGMLQMIAFGPETHLSWPPKPADPQAAWSPEWTVRVRTKSTAMAMLGMDVDLQETGQEQAPPRESVKKKILRGILGR